MRSWTSMARTCGALLLGAALWLPAAAGAEGMLLSARGDVRGAGDRLLGARDALAPGQRVVTGADGGAALSVGDLFVQMGPGTSLRVGEDGLELARGRVRVVDLGEAGAGARIRTPHAVVEAGGDAELLVGPERTELRQGEGRSRVRRADASGRAVELAAGQGAAITPDGIDRVEGVRPGLALTGADVDVAVATHFRPADVAAPPSSVDLFPFDPDKRTFHACDDPGSGCGGQPQILLQPSAPPPPPGPPSLIIDTGPADPPDLQIDTGPADSPGAGGPS